MYELFVLHSCIRGNPKNSFSTTLHGTNRPQYRFAPYDVYFDEHNAGIQPDIFFVQQERSAIIRPDNGIVGAPNTDSGNPL